MKKIDLKQVKKFVIKKVVLLALIVISGVAIGIIKNFADAYASRVNVEAGFDVMKGNTSTVEGIATHKLTAGSLEVGKIITTVIFFIVCFVFIIDICIDGFNFLKDREEKKE